MTTNKSKAIRFLEKLDGPLTIAQILRSHRMSADLSQVDMAKKLKISRAQLCDLENGRRGISIEKAVEYARLLNMSEKLYVQFALQDQLYRAGLKMRVKISAA